MDLRPHSFCAPKLFYVLLSITIILSIIKNNWTNSNILFRLKTPLCLW